LELPAGMMAILLDAIGLKDPALGSLLAPLVLTHVASPVRSEPAGRKPEKGESSGGQRLTDEQIKRAYELAYFLHPQRDVAMRVTIDALNAFELLRRREVRLARTRTRYSGGIASEGILQFALFQVSCTWELDQESGRPVLNPQYTPSREDLIVRYVKHLVWKAGMLNSCYVAIGIGCLLYSYRPVDILNLSFYYFGDANIRRVKGEYQKGLGSAVCEPGARA
jgi:hypothetical protein